MYQSRQINHIVTNPAYTAQCTLSHSPTMKSPTYSITTQHKVIQVILKGEWNPVIDLRYMCELADTVRTVNNKKWSLMVDMSQCHIHANNIAGQYANSLSTDRRNQLSEVWVVNRADQGDFFLQFGNTSQIKVHKCFSRKEGQLYLERQGFLPAQITEELCCG